MNKSLTNKFTLRIISVVIAFLIWLLVMTVEDPVMVQKITDVPVALVNEEYIMSTGKVPMINEGHNTVTVYVTGKTSVVGKLEAKDITAVADMQQIVNMDSNPIMVPVIATTSAVSDDKISTRPNNLQITLDDLDSKDSIVVPTAEGESKPEEGYVVGRLKSNPDKITIRGPHSILKNIDKVSAPVNVDGMTEDGSVQSKLKIYDKNGDELSETQVKALSVSETEVEVFVDLWERRIDIPVEVAYGGTPADGYQVGTITTTPASVTIAGTEEALAEFEEAGNKIVLTEDMVPVSGRSADFEITIEREDVTELFPEDIRLVNDNETFSVKVSILPLKTKEYSIPSTSITVNNKAEELNLVFESEKVVVRIRGKNEAAFAGLAEGDVKASIDVADLGEGEHEVPLTVTAPEGFEVLDSLAVKIRLTEAVETSAKTN